MSFPPPTAPRLLRRTAPLLAGLLAAALLLGWLHGRHADGAIGLTPDSQGYEALALQILEGEGLGNGARTPGYPLFISAVYTLHGPDPDHVLPYQIVLTGLTGALMALLGWQLWGTTGLGVGLVAVFLLGTNRDAAYPTSLLLTECLAAFLLTASAAVAAWAQEGSWRREAVVSLLIAATVMVRSALVFVGLAYGLLLLARTVERRWSRVAAFALPVGLVISAWSLYATAQRGQLVLLAANGSSAIVAGLDPVGAARAAGVVPPSLTERDLEGFWRRFPGYDEGPTVGAAMRRALDPPSTLITLSKAKIKATIDWLFRPLWLCMALGFALVASARGPSARGTPSWRPYARDGLLAGAALLLLLSILGWSHAVSLGFFLALPLLLPIAAGPGRLSGAEWLLAWYFGLMAMLLATIGHDRFIRPFLPVFYVVGTAAIPLLLGSLRARWSRTMDGLPGHPPRTVE